MGEHWGGDMCWEQSTLMEVRHEKLYIRLTKNEKERLRQFAGKVGMPLGEFVLNISLVYTEQYELMAS